MTLKLILRLLSHGRKLHKYVASSFVGSRRIFSIAPRELELSNFRSLKPGDSFIQSASTSAIRSPILLAERQLKAAHTARLNALWAMAAQLAKPFTIYVVPDGVSGEKRKFRLMFRYTVSESASGDSADQLLNFERDYDDFLGTTLMRVQMKLVSLHERASGTKKKGKRAKFSNLESESPNHEKSEWQLRVLTADGTELGDDVTNEAAFLIEGRSLMINGQSYAINGPSPTVTKAEVDLIPIVGYPVMPSVNVSEDSSVSACQYFWFTSETMAPEIPSRAKVAESIQITCDHEEVSAALRIQEMKGWTLRSTDRVFIPEERDAGRQVCLIVTPCNTAGRYGLPRIWTPPVEKATSSEVLKKGVVIAPPEAMVWTERQQLCADLTPSDSIRCVSYNILADLYMNLTVPDEEMYFPYCPRRYQTHNYRYPLLLKEISGYQADLYCLQEVDTRMYDRFLEAYMLPLGWRGVRKMKGGVVNEGSAIFYRPEKFELIDSDDHIISDLLAKEDSFVDLAQIAKQTELVWNIFFTRPAAVQVAVFRCLNVPNSFICVGNTHLHFKPHHSPIRLLQAAVGYRHLLNVVARIEKQYPNSKVAAIFCGDFNSTPSTGVYEMFQNGRLDAEHRDWKPEAEQVDDDDSEDDGPAEALVVQGINLSFSKRLRSACPSIEYTTLTHKFRGMLDHIFISDDLIVDRVVPMPRHELVTKYTGLPSPICPSDHLPLICELKFR